MKIASLTGLDPRRFDEAVQIRLACLLRSLRMAPAPYAAGLGSRLAAEPASPVVPWVEQLELRRAL